jgi:ABC-type nitrate/sulfonate/bicarbonate transport system permease component
MNRSVLAYFILPVLILAGWVLFSFLAPQELDIVVPFLLNSTNSVWDAFKTLIFGHGTFFQELDLIRHLFYSLIKVFSGYCIAVIIGIPLGILMGWKENMGRLFYPIVEIIRPIPPIAWIPCAILWFTATRPAFFPGIYYAGFIIFIGAFFPILLNTTAGVRGVRRLFIEAAKSLGANETQLLTRVIIPGALPSIVTGMRVGMGVGWMCLVGAEIVNAQYGLGYITVLGMRLYDLGLITSGMLLIGIMGLSIDRGFRYFEDRFLPWRGK